MDPLNKPRVLLAIPHLNLGGAESYVASLARSQHLRGYGVALASRGGAIAARLSRQLGLRHYYVNMRVNLLLASLLLGHAIAAECIDLVHANLAAAGEVTQRACSRLGCPWVMTVHLPFDARPRYNCFKHASRIICVSEYVKRAIQANPGLRPEQIVTIHSGIDLARFAARGSRLETRLALGIHEDDFTVAVVAQIRYLNAKGHLDLVRMLAEHPKAVEWQLIVTGAGRALGELKNVVREAGLGDRVHFTGRLADVRPVLEAADAVVLPSQSEAFPLSLVEAMAMARPVVAYSVGGIPELVEDGVTGFLVPRGDVAAMADSLGRLAADANLSTEMGRRGRVRVERHFSMERMVDSIEELYAQVAAEHRQHSQVG
jgi:glycosyltransferase involved in cell wall biosynthesis